MALREVGQPTCDSSLGDSRYLKNDHFETKEAAVPDRGAELLDKVVDYILSNGLADLSLRPLATAIDTSPRMLLYFFWLQGAIDCEGAGASSNPRTTRL